ncbi:MAG: CmpA/NrtA family ABC transporter substrate-binding protein [Alphaproteobacteria bacterium]
MAANRSLTLGVMPLTDAAPLIVALEKGFFAEENLDVTLVREASWATIRDKVMFRALDAAQMLAPMPLAMSFGLGHRPRPTIAPLVLSLNGNGITVSKALIEAIAAIAPASLDARPIEAHGLAAVIRAREAEGAARLRFGVVFPHSTHHVQLRAWLQAAGVDPESDIELLVVPPAQMAAELEAGRLDGYCVGEPWNQLAVRAGLGRLLITSYEIWPHRAEKVLGLAETFADQRPEILQALLRALIRAGIWLDRPDNRLEAAKLLVEGGWVRAPIEIVGLSLMGVVADGQGGEPRTLPDMHVFSRHFANFPWIGHAELYAQAMVQNGQLARLPERWELAQIFRPDLYRKAATAVGVPLPEDDIGPDMDDNIFTRWRNGLSAADIA